MGLIYGVDSRFPANMKLTNGYTLYDWVMRKSCYPSFWGRNITGNRRLTLEEVNFLKLKKCKIACIFEDFTEAEISGNDGAVQAMKAIEAAQALEIPPNRGVALFADVRSEWSVNHNWMLSYAYHLMNHGYTPGFIGNTDSSKNFNFDRQASHYIQASRDVEFFNAIFWASEPKYAFDPEVWAPYAPSELLPRDMQLWQYGQIDFHSIFANKNYMCDERWMKCLYDMNGNGGIS